MNVTARLTMVAAGLTLPLIGYGVFAGEECLIRFFPDDAFYYLQPAFHFSRTGVPSFDGLHPTNGFHPLAFLVTAAEAFFLSKPALMVATFLTDAFLVALAILLTVASFRPSSIWMSYALLAVLMSPPVIGVIVLSAGMEASLVILAAVLLATAFESALEERLQSGRKNLLLGAAMSAFLFARLDNIIVIAPFVILLMVAEASSAPDKSPATRLRTLASVFWLPALLGLAYLAANYFTTGHLTPISGYVKHARLVPLSVSWHAVTRGTRVGSMLAVAPMLLSVAMLAFVTLLYRGENGRLRARRYAICALNAGNVLFYAYLFFGASDFYRWYFATPIACCIVNAAFLVSLCRPLTQPRWAIGKWAAGAAVLLLIAASMSANVIFLKWAGSRENSTSYQLSRVAELVNRHGGAAAITGTFDAGVVGYCAAGTVINLDGLANSFDYYERYARPGRLLEYFQETGMTHFLVRDCFLKNLKEVDRGDYQNAVFQPDPRIVLRREKELFRYSLPGNFTVYYFALEQR